MITLVNQKRKGFVIAMTLALFLSVVCSPSYAANSSSTEDYTSEQQNRVTGKVVDAAGEPIPGANVFLKGTDLGVATGPDGTFAINVPANGVLEVSFIGKSTQDVNVGTRTYLDIILADDVTAISTAVITGFGSAQDARTVTGATTAVGSDIIGRTTSQLASTALMGKIAGLNFRQSSGRPGNAGGSVIRIRNSPDAPLYIIDGTESDAEKFNNLSYHDIENVTVLKDASAAVYGSKAGNGVMVVTTKRGRLGEQPNVTLSALYGWSNPRPYFPTPANAEEFIFAKANAQRLAGTAVENLMFSKEEYELWKAGETEEYQSYDWKEAILRTASDVNLRASVSGGSENTNYYFSLGQTYSELHIWDPKTGQFNRTNAMVNIDTKINNRLKVGVSASGSFKTDRFVAPNGSVAWNSEVPYGGRLAVFKNWPTQNNYAIWAGYEKFGKTYPRSLGTQGTNPYLWSKDIAGYEDDARRDMKLGVYLEYQIAEGLKLRVDGAYYYNQRYQHRQRYVANVYEYNEETDVLTSRALGTAQRLLNQNYEEAYTSKVQLNYKGSFGNHNLSAIAAAETYSRQNPGFSITSVPTSKYLSAVSFSEVSSIGYSGWNTARRAGFLGSVHYDYAEKYMVDFIGRYDGNSRYSSDKRWGFFPAVSAGWMLSNENFWKNGGISNVLNSFKIRGSWGKTGRDAGNAYDYLMGYNGNQNGIIYDGAYTLGSADRGVPKYFSWNWVTDTDFGIDFSMFNGRLRGSLDYFEKEQAGIIANRQDILLPAEVGYPTPDENLNSDFRRGMDGGLTWTSTVGEVGYSIGATFSYARRFNGVRYGQAYSTAWGQYKGDGNEDHHNSPNRFGGTEWGLLTDGQFQSWEEIAASPIDIDGSGNSQIRPGDFKYKDLNNDGRIGGTNTNGTYNNGAENYDIRVIRYQTNDRNSVILNYGINLAVYWRNLDVSLNFTGGGFAGYWIHNEAKYAFQNDGNIYKKYAMNQWRYDDPWAENPTLVPGKWPSLVDGARNDNYPRYFYSDAWKVPSDYVKLKHAEIGYTLPKAWLDKVNIKEVRLSLTGQNIFVLSSLYKDFGIDPEMSMNSGMDYNLPRVISLGLTLKF